MLMRLPLGMLFLVLIILSVNRCAKQGFPSGGPKDSIPPVLIRAVPPLETVEFDADKIVLYFDEYVQLKNLTEQLIVSPPIEPNLYEVSPQGIVSKKITVKLLEPPRKNTTFTFNFGSAIEDYNENNPLSFFNYSFSTGPYMDSLTLRGSVQDAFNKTVEEGVSIQLYPIDSTYTDSTIYLEKPFYVGNTLDSVIFNLKSLAPGKYEMIALKDYGKNYFFDQNIDLIGFFENPIELPRDSVKFPVLFKEVTHFQWGRPKFINDHHVEIGYYGNLEDHKVRVLTDSTNLLNGFFTRDRVKDTLHYWFTPPKKLDSLVMEFEEVDSIRTVVVKKFKPVLDSLVLNLKPNGYLNFNDTLQVQSNLPIGGVNNDFIQIFDIDTVTIPFRTSIDPNKDRVYLYFDKVPKDKYSIQLLPNAIFDFLGATNDTLIHLVRTKKIEDYGALKLNVKPSSESLMYFIEVLDSRDNIVQKFPQNQTHRYTINYLLPGKYYLRIIKDLNGNNQWDTGDYLKKIQPEQVIYLEGELDVRANWDLNETIIIEE